MPKFELHSVKQDGTFLTMLPFNQLQGEFFLSKSNVLRWEMPYRHPNVTLDTVYPGKTEIRLYRDSKKIFEGPLWDCTPRSETSTMNCAAEDVSSYLDMRTVGWDLTYTNQHPTSIAWDLIHRTQLLTNGDLRITQGTLVPTMVMTQKYAKDEAIQISKAIEDFEKLQTGFEWQIDENRVFKTYARDTTPSNVTFEYGGMVTRYSIQLMGKWQASEIIARGAKGFVSQPIIDTAKRAEYGLRQKTVSNTSIKNLAVLNDFGQQNLNIRRDTRFIPHITIRTGGLSPFDGDIDYLQTARVIVDDGWVQMNQLMYIVGWQLTVRENDSETIGLYMNDLRETE